MRPTKMIFHNRGIALILTLWVTALLTIMVGSFAKMVRTEVKIVSNFKDESVVYYFARSGIQQAILGLLKQPKNRESRDQEMQEKEWKFNGKPNIAPFKKGFAEVRVIDEGGKFDLNKANRDDLVRIFAAYGLVGVERDGIVDSILDWRDANNFHRLNGAEDDYYMTLPRPYESKDAPFETVDELLWVKGITHDIFYGEMENDDEDLAGDPNKLPMPGLEDIFTVYTHSVKVNVNTAALPVLISVLGIDKASAQKIMELRKDEEFRNMGDITRTVEGLSSSFQKFISFAPSKWYSIKATGRLDGSPVKRSLTAVIKINVGTDYKIMYWKDG